MGQGLYNLLGYGVLNAQQLDEDDDAQLHAVYELEDLHVHFAYETDPGYAVIGLAVDDEVLQDWWKLPAMPDEVLRCAPRRARYADEVTYPVPEEAKARWQKAQALYAAHGLTLGDARLIVLNDWD